MATTVCSGVTFCLLPEVDEVSVHNRISRMRPFTARMLALCGGFFHLSFLISSLFVSTQAAMGPVAYATKSDVIVESMASKLTCHGLCGTRSVLCDICSAYVVSISNVMFTVQYFCLLSLPIRCLSLFRAPSPGPKPFWRLVREMAWLAKSCTTACLLEPRTSALFGWWRFGAPHWGYPRACTYCKHDFNAWSCTKYCILVRRLVLQLTKVDDVCTGLAIRLLVSYVSSR